MIVLSSILHSGADARILCLLLLISHTEELRKNIKQSCLSLTYFLFLLEKKCIFHKICYLLPRVNYLYFKLINRMTF